ncbi:MAG: HU family DNA-binding protein [Candidatus Mycalebacterium zealandia]|nr:MAG: HU family DNA-binding protein [Candidatus Mycalebacterium zealandia]
MTKSDIASHIAMKCDISKKAAGEVLDEIASVVYKGTKKSKEFTLPGLGKFVVSKRAARMGRNPATGATIKIPAKNVVKFKVAKACKDAVVG